MKRHVFAALAMLAALNAQAQDWGDISRYDKQNKEITASHNDGRRVVFMGNSITENWRNFRPEFFTSNGYIGRGISGQTSYQFLVRFREDVVNLAPRVVVINCGTNDVAENTCPYNEDNTFGNIVSMVEIAQANNIKVVLTAVLPCAGFSWRRRITDASEKIASLNARLEAYAKAHDIAFVDYHTPLLAPDGRALNPKYTTDGCHPTNGGYEIMEPLVKKAISQYVE